MGFERLNHSRENRDGILGSEVQLCRILR